MEQQEAHSKKKASQKSKNIGELQYKVPPQNIEAEQAILGAIMLYNSALHQVLTQIQPEDFYLEKHQLIYRIMLELEGQGEPLDIISIANRLKLQSNLEKAGSLAYLSELADRIPTAANIAYYARLVKEKSLVRQLIEVGTEIVGEAYDDVEDVATFLDQSEKKIFEIREARTDRDLVPIQATIRESFNRIEKLYEKKSLVTGTPTGFDDFDKMTSGLQPSDLIILAARPSMGKTSFALNLAVNAAIKSKRHVAVFSLEMSKEQLVTRMLCSQARVDNSRMRTGHMKDGDIPRLTRAASELSDTRIHIDDGGNATVMEMRAKCRRLSMDDHGLALIVIDYLQLMKGDNPKNSGNREQEISEISRGLKMLAKELKTPILALSQLNRSLERRPDKRPMMSDLRESGAIEQDADVICFIYRDEVYNPETEEKGISEIIIGKQRNGAIGTLRLRFFNEYTRFDNLYPED